MRLKTALVAAFCVLVCTLAVFADTLTLKNGQVLTGKVIPQGDSYWIKLDSGETKVVPKDQVASFTKGDAKPVAPTPTPTPTPTPGGAAPSGGAPAAPGGAPAAGTSAAFAAIKAKADRVVEPVQAVQLWDRFLDSNPAAGDVEPAKAELEKWSKLKNDNAEKINGKWVGGKERKDLMKKVQELIRAGEKSLDDGQTTEGIKKLEEALKLYPRNFDANFILGRFYLEKGAIGSNGLGNNAYMDKAIKSLETASDILPKSAATWSNLAIGYNFKKQYAKSVQVAYKAVKIRENKATVQNLCSALYYAPPGMRDQAAIKPIMEDAILMAGRHGVNLGGGGWVYVRPTSANDKGEGGSDDPDEKAPPGAAWSGSGFFISSDGYIITNHHVATGDPKEPLKKDISFRVRMEDGTEKTAEVIAIDEEADIALMKIKTRKKLPFLKIANDNPNQAAKALVLGYPATGEENPSLQISEGTVKSLHPGGEHEVWFDLNTTHGNSGGPIVDRSGRVIGILTAGWTEYNMTIIGGVGPLQIKKFLDKVGDKAPKVEYVSGNENEFNGEKLTAEARKSTLFILAIRGAGEDHASDKDKDKASSGGSDEKPDGAGATDDTGGDDKGGSGGSEGGKKPKPRTGTGGRKKGS